MMFLRIVWHDRHSVGANPCVCLAFIRADTQVGPYANPHVDSNGNLIALTLPVINCPNIALNNSSSLARLRSAEAILASTVCRMRAISRCSSSDGTGMMKVLNRLALMFDWLTPRVANTFKRACEFSSFK